MENKGITTLGPIYDVAKDEHKVYDPTNKIYNPNARTKIAAQAWGIISRTNGKQIALRPLGEKILIREDEFKSRFDCKTCKGKGHTEETCSLCNGTKYEVRMETLNNVEQEVARPCRACTVIGERNISYGKKLCPTCNGKQGTIILTDESKKRPTTGVIIAIGSKVTEFKVGTHVIYNNYTGTAFELEGIPLRTMMQYDVHLEARGMQDDDSDSVTEDMTQANELSEAGI